VRDWRAKPRIWLGVNIPYRHPKDGTSGIFLGALGTFLEQKFETGVTLFRNFRKEMLGTSAAETNIAVGYRQFRERNSNNK
jgi:hypothetical protein